MASKADEASVATADIEREDLTSDVADEATATGRPADIGRRELTPDTTHLHNAMVSQKLIFPHWVLLLQFVINI